MKNYLNKNWPLLIMPLVMIPFIILIFYILGGGSAPASEKKEAKPTIGKVPINYRLPEADQTIGIVDKMEAVQAQTQGFGTQDYHIGAENGSAVVSSEKDSISELDEAQNQEVANGGRSNKKDQNDPGIPDSLMAHIRKQEVQVKLELRQAAGDTTAYAKGEMARNTNQSGSTDNSNLETDLKSVTSKINHGSTGIEEMDALFDRSLALARQNDSLSFKLQEANIKEQQRAADVTRQYNLEKGRNNSNTSEQTTKSAELTTGAIPAEIYETATVLTGNRVKIRLLEDTRLNGRKIPHNTFVYGICRTDNERLQIEVQQIQVGGQFIPVKITVCDLDGLPGLYVPDNASRKITKEVGSGANTSSMVGFTGNPLAYAGVQAADRAARSVLQVIKQKKVTIKKNTLVYLINKNK